MGLRLAPDAAYDLDSVHDGVRRWLIIAGGPTVCALLGAWQFASPTEGSRAADVSPWAGLGAFSLVGLSQLAARRGCEVPIQGDDCVLVPVRPVRERLLHLWLAATPLLALVIVASSDGGGGRRAGELLALSTGLACVYLPARLRRDLRIRLSPHGLRYLCGDLRERQLSWDDIEDVLPDPGRGRLFLLLRGDRVLNLHVTRYPWRASTIGNAILHFVRHPEARPGLTDVRALDPILQSASRSPC